MRSIAMGFAALGLALSACALEAGDDASTQAEALGKADQYEYQTTGGFTAFNFTMSIVCIPSSSGSVHVVKTFHSSTTPFAYDGTITKTQCASLRNAVPSNFATMATNVYFKQQIMDMPDVRVSYGSKSVTKHGRAGTPVASAAFDTFASKVGGILSVVDAEEYMKYSSSGGIAFRDQELTITNGGQAHLTLAGMGGPKDVTGYVDSATLVNLGTAVSKRSHGSYAWYALPAKFPGGVVADGITTSIRWDGPLGAYQVSAGTGTSPATIYTSVESILDGIVQGL